MNNAQCRCLACAQAATAESQRAILAIQAKRTACPLTRELLLGRADCSALAASTVHRACHAA